MKLKIINQKTIKTSSKIAPIPGLNSDDVAIQYLFVLENFLKTGEKPPEIDLKEDFFRKNLENMGFLQAVVDIINKLYAARKNPKDSDFNPNMLYPCLIQISNWVLQLSTNYAPQIEQLGLPDLSNVGENIRGKATEANRTK